MWDNSCERLFKMYQPNITELLQLSCWVSSSASLQHSMTLCNPRIGKSCALKNQMQARIDKKSASQTSLENIPLFFQRNYSNAARKIKLPELCANLATERRFFREVWAFLCITMYLFNREENETFELFSSKFVLI